MLTHRGRRHRRRTCFSLLHSSFFIFFFLENETPHHHATHTLLRAGCFEDVAHRFVERVVELLRGLVDFEPLGERAAEARGHPLASLQTKRRSFTQHTQ